MTMQSAITEFLKRKHIAVVGSFRHKGKVAWQIASCLTRRGYTVYPVNPTARDVDGLVPWAKVADLPPEVDALDIVTPPEATEQIVQDCLAKGIRMVWMQPGASSTKAIEFCRQNGIAVIHDACIMMCV